MAVSLGLPYQRILNLNFKPLDGAQAGDTETSFIANVTYVNAPYFSTLRIPQQGPIYQPIIARTRRSQWSLTNRSSASSTRREWSAAGSRSRT